MIAQLTDLLKYDFFTNAIYAAMLASITCGIIGTYIVARRLVFISGGITHASFGGIGIGYYLGINPILSAAIFAVFSALGIEYISKKAEIREDSLIGIFWSFGMAIGIIFIFISPGYAPNLMGYLFGSILTVTGTDLLMMVSITLIVILFFILFYKIILFISFDPDYARTHNAPVQMINYLLISLVAITIVINIKVVGIIMVISLLTIPQTIANLFTRKFIPMIYLSILLAFIGSTGGLFLSYQFNVPSGASIILSLVVIFILTRTYTLVRSRNRMRKVKY